MKYLLATRSEHKAREIRRVLGPRIALVTLDEAGLEHRAEEDELEPHDTFEANAVSKARYYARRSGLPTLADDSGLEVDALQGRPGVRTKRFAPLERYPGLDQDEANNRYLLEVLEEVPDDRRGGRYVCVAALCLPGSDEVVTCRGEAPGRVRREPAGSGGFGYDPVFQDPDTACSFAELTRPQKDAISHRGRAFRALAPHLEGHEPARGPGVAP